MAIILITGGARSGKSTRAEARAREFAGQPVYIATAEALDAEMRERIARHRARRGNEWLERETPLDLVEVLNETDGGGARLVDCLTLWLTNLMLAERNWEIEAAALAEMLLRGPHSPDCPRQMAGAGRCGGLAPPAHAPQTAT